MSEVPLYEVLTKLGVEPEEAKAAVADVASVKDVVTKDYLDANIAKLKEELTWRLVIGLGIVVAILKLL